MLSFFSSGKLGCSWLHRSIHRPENHSLFKQVGSHQLGLIARKPVFGVADKVSFKPVSTATKTS